MTEETDPEFDATPSLEYVIPTISFIDPNYIKQRYILTLTELEHIFGELRNATDERRLEIVEEMVQTSDSWLEHLFAEIGISPEVRAKAAEIELRIVDEFKAFLGFDPFSEDTTPEE